MSTKADLLARKPAIFVYRCRKCGLETTESITIKSFWDHSLFQAAEKLANGEVPLNHVHVHDGGSVWVSDLVGARNLLPEEIDHWML